MTTRTTAALSPRLSGIAAAVIAATEAALSLPANDNAGLAWRVDDAAEHLDDRRTGIVVLDRCAADLAPVIAAGVSADWWRAYAERSPSGVSLRPVARSSRAMQRRVRTLIELLRAAGVRCEWA